MSGQHAEGPYTVRFLRYPQEFEDELNRQWQQGAALINWQFHPEAAAPHTSFVLAVFCGPITRPKAEKAEGVQ